MTTTIAPRIVYSIAFYVIAMMVIVTKKPSPMFSVPDHDQKSHTITEFGVGRGKTLFSLGVVATAIAVSSFYVFALSDSLFGVMLD